MPLIDCPKCDGFGGWMNIDGTYVECEECNGEGFVDDDEPDTDE
jgi:DnaJ-class molecular chaperone